MYHTSLSGNIRTFNVIILMKIRFLFLRTKWHVAPASHINISSPPWHEARAYSTGASYCCTTIRGLPYVAAPTCIVCSRSCRSRSSCRGKALLYEYVLVHIIRSCMYRTSTRRESCYAVSLYSYLQPGEIAWLDGATSRNTCLERNLVFRGVLYLLVLVLQWYLVRRKRGTGRLERA